jgi:hypothetical protein
MHVRLDARRMNPKFQFRANNFLNRNGNPETNAVCDIAQIDARHSPFSSVERYLLFQFGLRLEGHGIIFLSRLRQGFRACSGGVRN